MGTWCLKCVLKFEKEFQRDSIFQFTKSQPNLVITTKIDIESKQF